MLFDCECLVGRPKQPFTGTAAGIVPDASDLVTEMERLGIDRALVRHRACIDSTPEAGNALLMEEIAPYPALVPAWHVTPDGIEGEWDPAAAVEALVAQGVRAAWTLTQGRDSAPFLLEPWCAGALLSTLEAHRVPLLVSYPDVHPNTLHAVLEAFPSLPIILVAVPRHGRNQPLYRLMALHRTLHLSLSPIYSVHEGIEDLCRQFGPERLLFGSGYPVCEGGAAVAALSYAEVSGAARRAIGGDNLQRLLEGVI
jgi:uncharacterized protein